MGKFLGGAELVGGVEGNRVGEAEGRSTPHRMEGVAVEVTAEVAGSGGGEGAMLGLGVARVADAATTMATGTGTATADVGSSGSLEGRLQW